MKRTLSKEIDEAILPVIDMAQIWCSLKPDMPAISGSRSMADESTLISELGQVSMEDEEVSEKVEVIS